MLITMIIKFILSILLSLVWSYNSCYYEHRGHIVGMITRMMVLVCLGLCLVWTDFTYDLAFVLW